MEQKTQIKGKNMMKVLGTRKFFLWFVGLWPEEFQRRPNISRIKLYFSFLLVLGIIIIVMLGTVFIVYPALDVLKEEMGFGIISVSFWELTAYLAGWSKIIPFVMNRTEMQDLILKTIDLEEQSSRLVVSDEEAKIIESWWYIRSKIIKYHGRMYVLLIVQICVLPMLAKGKVYPMETAIHASLFETPWYEIFYLFHCMLACFYFWSLIATDTIFVTIVCKLCEELERFERLLLEVCTKPESKKMSKSDILNLVIVKHCALLHYGENVCELLSGGFYLMYFFESTLVAIAAFTLLTVTSVPMLNRTIWAMIGCISQLFAISLAGEQISSRSAGLSGALSQSDICCSNFGDWRASELKNVIQIHMRMQKSLSISMSTNSILNIEFFTQTMKGIYSFYMMIRTSYG